MAFLIDRGSLTADRLEGGVRESRLKSEETKSTGPKRPVEPIETISDATGSRESRRNHPATGINVVGGSRAETEEDLVKQKSQAEKDLIDALRQVR